MAVPQTLILCPPHYWFIERTGFHGQQWTCRRCAAAEYHQDRPKQGSWASRSKKPVAVDPPTPSAG